MSKYPHQLREEQIHNRVYDLVRFKRENVFSPKKKSPRSKDIQKDVTVDKGAIQLRAYQIYREKGGSALDNWLEAERILKNKNQEVSNFINKGNSNTQN